MTSAKPRQADPAEILRALCLLLQPGQVTELRALDVSTPQYRRPHVVSGYYDDAGALAQDAARLSGTAKGVYFVPNAVNPALLARASNRCRPAEREPTTGDADIVGRLWLLIDCDPVRPAGISATTDEHAAALDRATAVRDALGSMGWPDGVLADSGNGAHLYYRVQLPPDDGGLCARVLAALAKRFDDAAVTVDQKVANPARIWKLPGTLTRKGDDTAERPHRLARILDAPAGELVPVSREQLEQLAGPVAQPASSTRTLRDSFDIDAWIARSGLDVADPEAWNGGRRWILPVCPWNEQHVNRAAFIVQHASGAISAGCHHNGCAGRGWSELRELVEPRPLRRYDAAYAWTEPEVPAAEDEPVAAAKERTVPPPMSFGELLTVPDPEERDLVEGLIPADANIIVAAYPKSHKTNTVLELGTALSSATPFLCRFPVTRPHRVGLVLMEDTKHRVKRRLQRMCMAHGVDPDELADRLHLWFRPPIRLADPVVIADLKAYAADLELDLLGIDNWSYVSTGDSNDADLVTQQLGAFSSVREARPGMSVLLVQHARKQGQDRSGERLTDIIRNSSAFGAWYDAGFVLSRPDEHSPVTVRAELRDRPAPAAFAFTVEDEFPGDGAMVLPSGYLRLAAADRTPGQVQRLSAAEQMKAGVLEHVTTNPGTSKRKLRDAIRGDNGAIDLAIELLQTEGKVRVEEAAGPGKPNRIFPTVLDRAGTVLSAHPGDRADRAAAPVGGSTQHTPTQGSTPHQRSTVAAHPALSLED
jgi:hypothetical protein